MNPGAKTEKGQSASTLLAVFWVIVVLSLAVMTCVSFVLTDVRFNGSARQNFEARMFAEKGIAIAANPIVKPWDPVLRNRNELGSGYEVLIQSEGARFNLNALLASQDEDLLQRIFQVWGLSLEEAQSLSDAMFDWVDPDDLERINGAERDFYEARGFANQPFNRPFSSLEEARLVAGMRELEALNPDWMGAFTLWSSGKLDVNEAEPPLISLACQCTIEAAEYWVETRRGEDGIENTEDDRQVQSLPELMGMLGSAAGSEAILVNRISFQDPTVRIVSRGFSGDMVYARNLVLQRNNSAPRILYVRDESL